MTQGERFARDKSRETGSQPLKRSPSHSIRPATEMAETVEPESNPGAPTDREESAMGQEEPATAGLNEIFAELIKLTKTEPLTALAISTGVGFLLGTLLKSRR